MSYPTPRPPGMADVAALAGVSHQTVSRVLNDSGPVSPATRARVLQAIDQLGYRRNLAARALVTRRTSTIGVVATDIDFYGPASTLLGIESAAREAGMWLSMAPLPPEGGRAMRAALERLLSQGAEAVVAIAPTSELLGAVRQVRAPVPMAVVSCAEVQMGADGGALAVERPPASPGAARATTIGVGVDQYAGARQAVEHLIALGHRDIAHVAGPPHWFDAAARADGWRSALADAGLPAGRFLAGDWSPVCGYAAGRQLLEASPLPTAVFCANDQMALGLIKALGEGGVRVPHEVSVVGFDDVPEAAFYIPGLTTVRQDFAALGRACVRTLVAALTEQDDVGLGDQVPRSIAPMLIARESTGPARA